jgi:histidinol-phosphate aminotransferase
MSIASIARPEIRRLQPYSAAEQLAGTVRLNANEAPQRASSDSFRRPLNRYPEIRPRALRQKLAARFGVGEDELLVTRGSSEAIDILLRCFCRAGYDNIVTTTPSFSMYRHYAEIQGAAVREIACEPDANFAIDPERLLARCDDDSRLIFLCSPNNPTGTPLARDTLQTILAARDGRSAVVVDEAYVEFSADPSVVDLLHSHDNLIVLRTLSKALAFAGVRCGVALGPSDVIGMLDAVQAPYALATPVVESIEDALEHDALQQAEARVAQLVEERERLIAELRQLSCIDYIWPSSANFILVRTPDCAAILEQTRRDKILLRHFGGQLADCLRITVGTAHENSLLLESLRKLPGTNHD